MTETPRLQPATQLWRRFTAIFLFLGLLSVASHLLFEWMIVGNEHSNALVNVAGRQRMLSQRIALFAEKLMTADKRQDHIALAALLRDSADLMEKSHTVLISGDKSLKIPAERSADVDALYFGPKSFVDQDVKRFISFARNLAASSPSEIKPGDENAERVFRMARSDFIADLDRVVRQYQVEGEMRVENQKLIGIASMAVFLATLIAMATSVFKPLVRRIQSEFEARESTERLLRGSERRQRTIVESALDGVITIDHLGSIVEFNPSALAMFGYNRLEDIKDRKLEDVIIPHEHQKAHREGMERLLKTGVSKILGKRIEVPALKSSGEVFPVELTITGYRIGEEQYFTAFLRDLSDEKRQEKEKAILEERLIQSQKMETMGTLAGGIAHDFNNILMPIIGYIQLMLRKAEVGSETEKSLNRVLKAADKATNLVRQIMTFSRQDQIENAVILASPLVEEAIKLLRVTTTTRIEFREDILGNAPPIMADPTRFQQIVMNLCTNAVQAMGGEQGVLGISLKTAALDSDAVKTYPGVEPGLYLKLEVSDTGTGMDEKTKNKVFEPFFTTKRNQGGTGLGLATTHSIVTSMKGFIRVESQEGKGTTFAVYLPTTDASMPAESALGDAELSGTGRVLIVDDVEENVDIISSMLETLGYEVVCFTDSREALSHFQMHSGDIDLIFTDQEMPEMTGDALAKAAKMIKPEVPIILATGYSKKISGRDPQSLGLTEIVFKPVTMEALGRAIKSAFH